MAHPIPLTIAGQTIAHSAGDVLIALTWIRDGVYRVSVNHSGAAGQLGTEVDGVSYPTEDEARGECRRAYRAFYGRTLAQVEQRRAELADLIDAADHRRGPDAIWRANKYRDELDAIAPLRARAADRALAEDIAATMTAAFDQALVPAN